MSNAVKTTLLIVCAVILLAAALLAFRDVFAFAGYSYDNAAAYTAGGAEIPGPVQSLDIGWVSGKVNIVRHSGNSVLISETSSGPISGDFQLRWQLDGGILRVRYAKNGFRTIGWTQSKDLTVSLPEDADLDQLSVSASSADLSIPLLRAQAVQLTTTSGDITASVSAGSVHAVSTSGDLSLTLSGPVRELKTTSTSGSVRISAEEAGFLEAGSTSGSISVTAGTIDSLRLTSTSGNVQTAVGSLQSGQLTSTSGGITVSAEAMDSLNVSSTSGDVSVFLPAEPGFTASVRTTSGRFDYSLPIMKNGSSYTCGDGSKSVSIHTTSGNVRMGSIQESPAIE